MFEDSEKRGPDAMNRDALFCDGTQDYVIPAEPEKNEKITLRFRTAHNDVEEVSLLTENRSYAMWKISAGDEFDFMRLNGSSDQSRSGILLR